ncbi:MULTISPECIES: Fe-S cluster assembly protein SufD [unclassified Oceanispirochaeta]|uniref:Fe-S cluster assembly protein SufD n=1 Tax=unclassified Oceanispirochaeta TaxID=2635722 RepID=UPI000E096C0C|nr:MULTISPECIES: Fe-S cluster assembly protein SufD [unclassified Oceanispirochaeta]MBF9018328.1 Fe-S cluster assembly protein SufD [Oceanispirochaeta sp. M2]NPD74793.1 Fe-S cluster assembly protein SufD [Oceanispirochaeta sp. M1]RDG29346.1 Fe-S cluster assembly protein SufD [Oceanispirochaeta sp. M1]
MKTYTETAAAVLKNMNWPDKKVEIWRRTPVRLLDPISFSEGVDENSFDANQAVLLPFKEKSAHLHYAGSKMISGVISTQEGLPEILSPTLGVSRYPEQKDFFFPGEWADRFEAWNDSAATNSVFLNFPEGKILKQPFVLQLDSLSRNRYSAPRIFIRIGEGWEGKIFIATNGSGKEKELVNASLRVWAGEGSHSEIVEIQTLGRESRLVQNTIVRLERDSRVTHSQIQLGAAAVKGNAAFRLAGVGAELQAGGIFTSGKDQHKDLRLEQKHIAPHTSSRALYKGAVSHRGRSVFQGMIKVEHEARGTDAYLSNKNLILNKGARADAIPGLKILTDDVKCSHGSTTGKLDPSQIFYLMSRGISRSEAVKMLTEGMFQEIIIRHPELPSDWLKEQIARSLEPGEL